MELTNEQSEKSCPALHARVIIQGRKREKLRKCVEKFSSIDDRSLEEIQDKSVNAQGSANSCRVSPA